MQPISLTPAPTRTFAEIETLGPICSKKETQKIHMEKWRGREGRGRCEKLEDSKQSNTGDFWVAA